MGAYLSEPKTTKESIDSEGVRVRCGASSMQGWRVSQEDAHNCILDFDKDASLFAVYDGHGGHEVAEYCSKNLPEFIKHTENYMKGEFEQALKDAFLGFDATLATPEVVEVLKTIASGRDGEKTNSDPDAGSDSEDEEAIDSLVHEAHMPLDEVMAKYKGAGPLCRVLKGEGKPPVSPMLRGRRTGTSIMAAGSSGSSSSRDGPSSSSSGSSSGSSTVAVQGETEVSSSSSSHLETPGLCNGETHSNGELDEGHGEDKTEVEAEVESSDVKKEKVVSESVDKSDTVKKCEDKIGRTEPDSSGLSNGESHDVSSSSENGDASAEGCDGISSSSPPKKKRVSSVEIYQKLLQEDSDSEEEDATFTADAESEEGSSDDADDDTEDKEADDEDEESSADEEEEEDDDDTDYQGMDVKEEPGSDSGCTAVVALLVGSELFVANAGDSRCVVCREGKAVEMSFDHKPEDEPEKERIEAAGGKVTCDGRVNGGLNLSRAIGDHSYKQVKLLPAARQMISALPDIKRLSIDPVKDQFMVLACDGIWNSMTSQEVIDFVSIKLQQKTEKLSQICEELFDHCLAPNTLGDGTGCDNMTCVIVQFQPEALPSSTTAPTPTTEPVASSDSTNKRPLEQEEATPPEEPSAKKSKVEEEMQTS